MQEHTTVVEQELVPGVLLCPLQQGQQGVPIQDPDGEHQSHQFKNFKSAAEAWAVWALCVCSIKISSAIIKPRYCLANEPCVKTSN